MARTRDMTRGSPTGHIILFALPLMLGNIFQQLYTATDAAIVGQFAGVEALGAVGSADWPMWLWMSVIVGFMQGFSILLAQRFGARDNAGLRRAAAMAILLGAGIALFFTATGLFAVRPMLRLLGTEPRVLKMAEDYLYILFAGICVTAAYNLLTALLRAMGNSRAPLLAMVAASTVNVGLDLWFVLGFGWGVRGAAAATVVAQGAAALICLFYVRRFGELRFTRADFRIHPGDMATLLRLAFPMAFQNALIALGGMAVQRVINGLGFFYVAGFTATNKLYGVFEMAAVSFGYAITTYAGQNLGAGDIPRIRRGVNRALVISLTTSITIGALMFLFGEALLSLFIEKSADPQVLAVAKRYLFTMAAMLPILYFLYVYRSALQGMGDTVMPMVSGLGECAMRVGVAWALTYAIGAAGIYYAEPAAWAGAAVILAISYYARQRRMAGGREK
jgi:putative MATE family efflux protein